jgi:hypothetical protein
MDKVLMAKDKAKKEGFSSVLERITVLSKRYGHKYVSDRTAGNPVYARIDWGRWIADCECGGAEMVDPDEALFFCLSCGNKGTSGRARVVEFPDNRDEIETKTMLHPSGEWQNWNRGE